MAGRTLFSLPIRCSRQKPICVVRRAYSQDGTSSNPFMRYVRSLKWTPIPLTVGFAYIGYQHFGHILEREGTQKYGAHRREEKQWQARLYSALPLRLASRVWGYMHNLELPVWLRRPLLRAYIKAFDCNLYEAEVRDLTQYRNLGEFFRRPIKAECRPVNRNHSLVCPSDGRVLHYGLISGGRVEQVKGVTYALDRFLGPADWQPDGREDTAPDGFADSVKTSRHNALYHCVIYLAPGDYHRFHSPTDWTVEFRRHFPGELLSVNPFIARWLKGLFNLNERAVYVGQWKHGFFAMAAVGATNVGSIRVYHDETLHTNAPGRYRKGSYLDETCSDENGNEIVMKMGDSFGEFNLGSTIVLIFEAPKNFDFKVTSGQKVKFGQPLSGS